MAEMHPGHKLTGPKEEEEEEEVHDKGGTAFIKIQCDGLNKVG
jgi:hypothetical protein